jgi:diguanylate cyclase (GGDEF)-like protein
MMSISSLRTRSESRMDAFRSSGTNTPDTLPRRRVSAVLTVVMFAFLFVPPSPAPVFPLDLRFERLTRDDGLTNSSISSILQDQWGFMWFGTQGGLHRWDGYSFKVYGYEPFSENCLSHNLIQTMHLDPNGEVIWIGTYGGLNRFHIQNETFTVYAHDPKIPSSLSNNTVVSILRDNDGWLWVGTLDGLNLMRAGEAGFTRFRRSDSDPHSISGNTIRTIYQDSSGTLWIGTTEGLNRYDRVRGNFTRVTGDGDGIPGSSIMSIVEDDTGVLWLGIWETGITAYDPRTGSVRNIPLAPDEHVYAMMIDRSGRLYAATWGKGLLELDRKSLSIVRRIRYTGRDNGLAHDTVYSLFEDESGILWIGTNGGGISKFDPRKNTFPLYVHDPEDPQSLAKGKVSVLYEDSAGTLWAGIYNGGLDRFDPETETWTHFTTDPSRSGSISDNNVTSLLEDSSGRFWVGTQTGLNLFDRESGRFTLPYPRIGDPAVQDDQIVYALAEDRTGKIWIGTYTAGVSVLDPVTGTFRHYRHDPDDPGSLSDNLAYRIYVDNHGRVWIATNNGLARYDERTDSFRIYRHDRSDPASLSDDTVRDILESSDGSIWVATIGGGVSRMDPDTDRFIHYLKTDGLPDNAVTGLLEDEEGTLWVSTPNGLAVFEREENGFRSLDEEDGVLGREFNVGRVRSRTGTLYFGSLEGIQGITSRIGTSGGYSPQVLVTEFRVFETPRKLPEPIYRTKSLTLSSRDSYFSFTFSSMDFTSPGKNRYAYRLEGFDKDWIYSGTRNYATYTNIPPGNYVFRVRGTNSESTWSEREARIGIRILPPAWQTWWAYLLYAAAVIGLLYIAGEIRTGAVLKQKVKELRKTKDELASANRKHELLSLMDELTGVPNRRHFNDILTREWHSAARTGKPLSVLMLDLDFFKAYNDSNGHLAGDECLRKAAEAIRATLDRPRDLVARFGGEEFIVLLPETDEEGAIQVSERIRCAVQKLAIPHGASEAGPVLTVSVGAATAIPSVTDSPDECIRQADAALYRAKAAGRNTVIAYRPTH